MPFRTVLCLCALAALPAAAGQTSPGAAKQAAPPSPTTEKKDFVNPNPGGFLKPPAATAPDLSELGDGDSVIVVPKNLPPDPGLKLTTSPQKQCSIPLKWAKVQKSAPDPRGRKWIGPHPERIDPMYAAPPAPVCLDADNKTPDKPNNPPK